MIVFFIELFIYRSKKTRRAIFNSYSNKAIETMYSTLDHTSISFSYDKLVDPHPPHSKELTQPDK